ncbi:hypothetical protein CIB48_g10458 [Xylaria polymorpha]|nr:hypothetical protein CIB48_g10458 [Xylaria polymorpha]
MSDVFLSEAHSFVWASVGIATVTFFCVAVFNLFFHPLAGIPGPPAAAISDFWLMWKLFTLKKCESIHECLLKYGSVVRVGPNKLVVSSQDDIKTIYGPGSKCLKSSFYPAWNLNGATNIFSNVDPKDHSFRRSLTARTFSKQTAMRFMPQLIKHAQELADRLELLSKGNRHGHSTVEFIQLARYLALDMLGTSVLDEDFELLKKGINHPFVDDLDAASLVIPARATLPTWVWFVVKRLPIPRLQHLLGGEGRLAKYAASTIERYITKSDGAENKGLSLVSCYSNYRDHAGNRLSTDRFIGEISAAYFAGTDTISVTLSFAVYEIARRADVQERLRAELAEKAGGSGGRLTYEVLEKDCAYLSAVISEVLRLYAALPSHLERVVPQGGMVLSTGHHIPAGTIVGTQPFSLHRDATLFPDPSRFDPDRWLDATPEMRKALCPWGFGSRILAYIEFRLALAVLVGGFDVALPPGYDHEAMRMKNFWFVFPQGGKVNILVMKRSAGEGVTIC